MGGCCSASSNPYERLPLNHTELDVTPRPAASQRKKPGKDDFDITARFFLRSKPGLSLVTRLDDIGQRPQKHYFTVKSDTRGAPMLLMTLVERPKECVLPLETETGRYAFEQILTGIKSHFVYPTIGADYIEEKRLVVVFRDVESKGSLRDLLFQAKWSRSFAEKYTTKRGTTFSETRACTWGRHILEGIMALRVKGFPPGHIHTGNIIVENNVCRITDYENKLLNLRPAYMAIIQSQPLVARAVDPDVACFGAILFEMCTGYIMHTVDLVQAPASLPASLAAVLNDIFYASTAPPTLEQLVSNPPFSNVQMPDLPPLASVRLGVRAKEALQEVRRASLVGPSDTKKPPRPPAKPQRYTDTPLVTTSYTKLANNNNAPSAVAPTPAPVAAAAPPAAVASVVSPRPSPASVVSPRPSPAPAVAPKAAAPAAPAPPRAAVAPPPPPAPVAAPPPPPLPAKREASGRGGLLNSIEGFSKGGLKKVVTVDKSGPNLKIK